MMLADATSTREDWKQMSERLQVQNQAFIDGEYVDAKSGETYECISPIAGQVLTKVAACDKADVDRAVASARAAFEDRRWSGLGPETRKRILLKFADLIRDNTTELALLETLDVGKPIRDTLNGDIPIAADCIQYFAEAIDKLNDEIAPTDPTIVALVRREPIGVVGAVVPWNFALDTAAWKIGPALAAGNSVILKPAEQSPLTAIRIAQLAIEAGLPEGVLNVVPGFGETAGAALGRHMDVDKVAFTGSAEVGKLFLRYAGESNMKMVSLECGGKTPHIVMPDATNIEKVATAVARGIFFNQGEVCNAGSRLLVHASLKDDLASRVMELAGQYKPGDPLDPETRMGAIVDENQLQRILTYVSIGQKEGARLLLGGQRTGNGGGYYVEPTIFDQVTNKMRIAQEEIFGPVLSIIGFENFDQAIAIANDSMYGLAAAIWTRDINTAFMAAQSLRAGIVCVNSFSFGWNMVPFGGFKQSGFGRDQSLHALNEYRQLKTTWIDLRE